MNEHEGAQPPADTPRVTPLDHAQRGSDASRPSTTPPSAALASAGPGAGRAGVALTLASASPRRRELLAALGLPFDVTPADVDETIAPGEDATGAVVRLARAKAEAVAWRDWDGLVLGADTVVVLDGRILGKPAGAAEATAMLLALRDREHAVVTGVALCDSRSGAVATAVPATTVCMRHYTNAEIAASVAAGTPFDKAGAYAIQDDVLAPVARIDGCYCTVVGLPLWSVSRLLRELCPDLRPRAPSESRQVCASCPLADS